MELAMANGFFELSQDEMMVVDGGEGVGLAIACTLAGAAGIWFGPPGFIAAVKVASVCWYAGSTLVAVGGVVSCFE